MRVLSNKRNRRIEGMKVQIYFVYSKNGDRYMARDNIANIYLYLEYT